MPQNGMTSGAERITAVLGPTNTGKTYLAIERMLGHASGMIGFPLRLLARENYDRIAGLRGAHRVALVTGEEKIIPPHASWWVCTVESMPLDRSVGFLAVDEVQLAGDAERGHIFTDRILHARGRDETMFLGADTARPILRRLVPSIEVIQRPRFSTLSYAGPKKLTRLPRRTAVVAFSANDVYEIADLVRRQRGGAAVVLGALSPRARNAQVGLYQAGEVDYMVATDAIGMGLNMDLDHVAFARLSKFDGRGPRRLTAAEIAQIAGRAGRHMNDGSFGTTDGADPLDPELVEAVENHRFDPLKSVFWRNTNLSFRSLSDLLRSLDRPAEQPYLMRKRDADDHTALQALARDPEIAARAERPDRLRLLWEVCQIPDFRKIMTDAHTRLLGQIYGHLSGPAESLPTDWVSGHVARLDRTEGDIDTLVQRIAHIRTWTYISHRPDWLADAQHWQERARAIEDKLSDALHERLTQRFVDRRSSVLSKRLKDADTLAAAVNAEGDVLVEGHYVGRLEGLAFRPDASATGDEARALAAAARRVLPGEIARRIGQLESDADHAFAFDADGRIVWSGTPVARLAPGRDALSPQIEPIANDFLSGHLRQRIQARLGRWLGQRVANVFKPLFETDAAELTGPARGLAFQIAEGLGSIPAAAAAAQVSALGPADRKALARLGIKLGMTAIYHPALVKPAAIALRAQLWAAHRGIRPTVPPAAGRISVAVDEAVPEGFYAAIGFQVLGGRAIRVDMVERLAAIARRLAAQGPFAATGEILAAAACKPGEIAPVLAALGYRAAVAESGTTFVPVKRARVRRIGPRRAGGGAAAAQADSPFAALRVKFGTRSGR
ncbi:MAG: disulfide oxidoreductase [Alphaproteobacteria bacterium]|nr:disulfide oxidoreductase [Alphaproteobacteria bacterium]